MIYRSDKCHSLDQIECYTSSKGGSGTTILSLKITYKNECIEGRGIEITQSP